MAVRRSGSGAGSDSDDDAPSSVEAVLNYQRFRQRLQADLAALQQLRDKLMEEERQYAELESNIVVLQREQLTSFTTLVPLGAGLHAQAAVPDTSRIFVHVALGFHPELTLDEAQQASALRREHLRQQIEARGAEVAGVLAHLRLVEQALADLAELQRQQERGKG